MAVPEVKWQEVSVDFVTDLPTVGETEDLIMTIVDRATKMVHLISCKKIPQWEKLHDCTGNTC